MAARGLWPRACQTKCWDGRPAAARPSIFQLARNPWGLGGRSPRRLYRIGDMRVKSAKSLASKGFPIPPRRRRKGHLVAQATFSTACKCWDGRPAAARPSISGRFAPAAAPRGDPGLPCRWTNRRQADEPGRSPLLWGITRPSVGGGGSRAAQAALERPGGPAAGAARAARPPPPTAEYPPTKKPPTKAATTNALKRG